MSAHLKAVETKSLLNMKLNMESSLNAADALALALHLAIAGVEEVPMDDDQRRNALHELAYLVCEATAKCRREWRELDELSSDAGSRSCNQGQGERT
jgi:hypothetical protein